MEAALWVATRNPDRLPPTIALDSILLRASMTIMKRGKRGSPWKRSREIPMKPYGLPLI
jgi:hypothetical protein